jgi:hypothetical protein
MSTWGQRNNQSRDAVSGRQASRLSASASVFQVPHIEKLLSRGMTSAKITKALRNELADLSPSEQRKVVNRIKTQEHKHNQGKKGK